MEEEKFLLITLDEIIAIFEKVEMTRTKSMPAAVNEILTQCVRERISIMNHLAIITCLFTELLVDNGGESETVSREDENSLRRLLVYCPCTPEE